MGPAVELRKIAKCFGDCVANAEVSFRVEPGTIHAIVGENGAGKSTAMKMLFGLYEPDSGEILLRGKPVRWRSPQDSIKSGIGMVHQHFMLSGPDTALDNVIVGPAQGFSRIFKKIDRNSARTELEKICKENGFEIPWDLPVEKLSVGIQQRLEIVKLLYRKADILILDEPTAVLTPQEVDELFKNLRKLRSMGKTILMITHKLKEVMALSDSVTVFRAGRVVGESKTSETKISELAEWMVGRRVNLDRMNQEAVPVDGAPVVLKIDSVRVPIAHGLEKVSIEVRKGEILGIAGVEGNGQSALLNSIFKTLPHGARMESGTISVDGVDLSPLTTREIKNLGIGFVPEDRHHEGLLLKKTVQENFLLGHERGGDFQKRGILKFKQLEKRTHELIRDFDVRPAQADAQIGRLSGGNQQKVIIAREFERPLKLLVVAQPTRGVDIGAIEFIHKKILEARNSGTAILLVSSELDEILSLSDRILVLYAGRVAKEFKKNEFDDREIGFFMGGGVR